MPARTVAEKLHLAAANPLYDDDVTKLTAWDGPNFVSSVTWADHAAGHGELRAGVQVLPSAVAGREYTAWENRLQCIGDATGGTTQHGIVSCGPIVFEVTATKSDREAVAALTSATRAALEATYGPCES